MRSILRFPQVVASAALLSTAGCGAGLGDLGTLAEVLLGSGAPGGGQQGQLVAEIQQVNTRQQTIQVRTQEGQTGAVGYDNRTQVIYQQQQYPVTALQPGDIVAMQLQQAAQGYYVSRIDVQQTARERAGQGAGQVQQFTGQVGQIDRTRGLFELRMQSGTITVALPFNASQTTVQRFNSLRTGNSVRIEGVHLGSGRVELHRFF
jgi:hypothetical protein